LLVELGGDVRAQDADRHTPLHYAAANGHEETVNLLMEMGGSALSQEGSDTVFPERRTSLHDAKSKGHAGVAGFQRKNTKNKRRSKSTTVAPVVDPATRAAAEETATAMAALLIAEEEHQKQAPPSKQGSSKKARKNRNRRKVNPDERDTGSKGPDEATGGSLASSRGTDNAGETDDMGRDAQVNAHGGEESAGLVFDNTGRGHNELEGSISRGVQRVEDSSVACEAGTCWHSGVQQPTTTQAEKHRQPKQRERQRQRKRATTRATLEEALAQVNAAGASLDTLNALDAAIVSAKRILEHGGTSSSTDAPVGSSCAIIGLPELLRQAEEKASNLRREVHVVAEAATVDLLEERLVQSAVVELSAHIQEQQPRCVEPPPSAALTLAIASAENETTCIICLAAPQSSVLLPCNHQVMCAECATEVLSSSSQPQCPVCRARVTDCIYF